MEDSGGLYAIRILVYGWWVETRVFLVFYLFASSDCIVRVQCTLCSSSSSETNTFTMWNYCSIQYSYFLESFLLNFILFPIVVVGVIEYM